MLPLPNPLTLYLAAGTLVVGSVAGYKIRDWQCDAAYAKALERAAEVRQEMQDALDERSRDFEAARDQVNVLASRSGETIREIYRQVPAPAPSCAAPDNIVRLLESGVRSANAATTSKSGGQLSFTGQPTDTSDRSREKSVGEPVDSKIHGVLGETPTDD
jgi:hypothetical protein